MVTSCAKGSRSVAAVLGDSGRRGEAGRGGAGRPPHLPCSLSGPGLSLHPSSARPETAGVGGSLPATTPPTARRRRDRARRTSAGQGRRAPGLRAQAPPVTSGGATPAMLRAAPETGRARGGPSASLSRRPGLPRGLLEAGRVPRSGSQRRPRTASCTPKTHFSSVFTEKGGNGAARPARPRGLAGLWRWFPPPRDKVSASLRVVPGSVPGRVAALPKKAKLVKADALKAQGGGQGVDWTRRGPQAARASGARLRGSSPYRNAGNLH